MKYDFTTILNRRGKDAIALDMVGGPISAYPAPREGFDVIPMWVADMNFPVVPTIQEAMIERAKHPTFGYFMPRQEYTQAIIDWQLEHNGAEVKPEHIGYENGVLGGVATALSVLCSKGDNVLVHSPTYVGFTGTLTNNGYHIVHSPLVIDEDGIWRMDFADMEKKIVENNIHMGHIMNAFRVAIVGQSKGFGMYEMCEVIGKEETLSRLDKALATLPVI